MLRYEVFNDYPLPPGSRRVLSADLVIPAIIQSAFSDAERLRMLCRK